MTKLDKKLDSSIFFFFLKTRGLLDIIIILFRNRNQILSSMNLVKLFY